MIRRGNGRVEKMTSQVRRNFGFSPFPAETRRPSARCSSRAARLIIWIRWNEPFYSYMHISYIVYILFVCIFSYDYFATTANFGTHGNRNRRTRVQVEKKSPGEKRKLSDRYRSRLNGKIASKNINTCTIKYIIKLLSERTDNGRDTATFCRLCFPVGYAGEGHVPRIICPPKYWSCI